MTAPNLTKLHMLLNTSPLSTMPSLNLAVLRNVTIENIEVFLRHEGLAISLNTRVFFGGFDQIFQDATLPGGPVNSDLDAILVFPHLLSLSPSLGSKFNQLTREQIEKETERIQSYAAQVIKSLRAKSAAAILWHSFETPLYPANGILDDQQDLSQQHYISDLNRNIADTLRNFAAAYMVNLDRLRSLAGADQWMDHRLWHAIRCPYSLIALQTIAHENFKFIRALKGRNRKMLVLDCDNTLWGGIVAEDGLEGIALGQSFPGSAYLAFQQEVSNLAQRGILIGLCSKNNAEDVWEVFDKHPDMILQRKDIACARINWSNKDDSLREMAAQMNLSLDSFVFIDDTDFEIGLINQLLPQVETIQLHPERAEESAHRLASCGLFDSLIQVQEDSNRAAMYQAESRRKQLLSEVGDMTNYLLSLETRAWIMKADDLAIPRIAQLTQKTNQFNLTTRRYTEAHIKNFAADPNVDVFHLKVSDRLGDSGIVGVCIIKYEERSALIDTFLLSCRVLGREIEYVFLYACLRAARNKGALQAIGFYVPSSKNQQTSNFYLSAGFHPRNDSSDATFSLDLKGELPPFPAHFKEIKEPHEHKEDA